MKNVIFMNLLMLKKYAYVFLAGITVLLLAFAVTRGLSAGKRQAQARLVAGNAQALSRGLEYFYQDQDRYPTALEFADAGIMLGYFNLFPAREFASGSCLYSYAYKRLSNTAFNLDFCLPGKAMGYKSGWNSIINDKNR